MHKIDQVPKITTDAVQLPGHQGVARSQAFQTGVQAGSVVALAGGMVFIEAIRWDAGPEQRIALQVEYGVTTRSVRNRTLRGRGSAR